MPADYFVDWLASDLTELDSFVYQYDGIAYE